ncbi:hypothetical protein K8B83_14920 [Shewanella inventionis]|uniref:hypothetical protein n=1 Tax=Shewanella inventionis TaxID=1738770 RepID=UPI001CBEE495|nr:hypothetical protein [Shewanella inventionis]UAL42166.1 hypothetical protein K8B83_14920 [Shewanella inventionis]
MKPFEYINTYYNVNAELGRKVVVDGEPGVIAKDCGHYIGVNFDKHKPGDISNCHPTWRVEYGAICKIRKPTASQRRYQRYLERGDCFDSFKHFLLWESSQGGAA